MEFMRDNEERAGVRRHTRHGGYSGKERAMGIQEGEDTGPRAQGVGTKQPCNVNSGALGQGSDCLLQWCVIQSQTLRGSPEVFRGDGSPLSQVSTKKEASW